VLTDPATKIQVVEHNLNNASLAPTQNYYVNWTAPADASGGSVRFNVAANSANGDVTPLGDYIYTFSSVIAPAASAPPDFSLSAFASTATVTAGDATTVGLTVTPASGFSGAVNFAVSGLPAGASASFNPATVTGGGTVSLNINTTSAVANAVYPLIITGTSGSLTHSTPVSLTVNPPLGNSAEPFSMSNLGSTSAATNGSGNLSIGYATIQPAAGGTTPAGVEIFSFRPQNVLVSETGVPASPLITAGRIYAETTGPIGTPGTVNTGLAIANPGSQAATLTMFFTDSNGVSTASHQYAVAANNQAVAFLIQAPFADPSITGNFQGTFSFTSTAPVSVIALRGFTNEHSDFLISTLPVIDTTAAPLSGTQVLPHFAAAGGWTTQVILINPGTTTLTGTLQFVGTTGSAATVTVGNQSASSAAYSVPAQSSQKIVLTGATAASTITGSIHVVPAAGGTAPTPLAVFSFKPSTITVSEAGAPANQGTAFRMYVQNSGVSGQPGNIQSGIAVANTTTSSATVTFELFNPDGSSTGLPPVAKTIPASGQMAAFLAQVFTNLPPSFQGGVLRISSASAISVVGLRGHYNENTDFLITTTPPTLESAPASNAELLFPHLVNGGGYTTQFILFSGTAGQTTSGTLSFVKPDGTPLFLFLQ
jgi:hypothetical protein